MFTALLDTCVLWPSVQRDFLLSLAVELVYRPVWSSATLDELEYHEALKLQKRGEGQGAAEARASSLIAHMRSAFADAEVTGWEPLEGSYGLPDPDDEHVLAAAQLSGAGVIVTENHKDFPESLLPIGIETISAKDFVRDAVALSPERSRTAVTEIAKRSGRQGPALSVDEVLAILESRYNMIDAVDIIRASS